MVAFILRTRSSLFAHILRRARTSSVHLLTGTKYRIGYRATLPWCIHVPTTARIVGPPFRSFGLASNLSAVVPVGVKKGGDCVKKVEESPVGIKILPSKPHHAYQEDEQEITDIGAKFDKLYEQHGTNSVVCVLINGAPASGKTQLAREFGERHYRKLIQNIGGASGNKAVVATLDARTPAGFLRSYLRLAENLDFPLSRYNVPGNIQNRIAHISIDVRKALAGTAPDWLLIIDGIDPGFFTRFYLSLPHPGDDNWGQGRILVTTRHDHIFPYPNDCAKPYMMHSMSEANAVSLLNKVSGYEGEGAEEVVNSHYVRKMPFDVASAGIYMKKAREEDPEFTNKTYLIEINDGMGVSPVADAARELAWSDKWLKKVFTILALCAHEPLPLSTFERFLKAQPNDDPRWRIQAIKDCDLLTFLPEQEKPTDSYDEVERVYFYEHTHKAFNDKFIRRDFDSGALVKQHHELVKMFADCLLEEYENATATQSPGSQWMKQLLLPHLEKFHQDCSFDQNLQIRLCVALSNAYTDVIRDPERAYNMLEECQAELKEEEVHPRLVDKLNLELWKAYRCLRQYERSTEFLMKVLREGSSLKELDVVNILKELTATIFTCEECTHNRGQLEKTLKFYDDMHKRPHKPKPSVITESLIGMVFLCNKMGECSEEEHYLEKTLQELRLNFREAIPLEPSTLTAVENLVNAYMKTGEQEMGIKLLQCIADGKQIFPQKEILLLLLFLTVVAVSAFFIISPNESDANHSHPTSLSQPKGNCSTEEEPLYDNDAHRDEIFQKHDPIRLSRSDSIEHQAIEQFAQEIEIVIQSCNPNEYYASLKLMEAPDITKPDGQSHLFQRAVRFPNKEDMKITLGVFAGYKAAIVWTEQGASCEEDVRKVLSWFPNTKALLGVGVAYGMNRDAGNVCDVLVAKQIADFGDRPRVQEGGIYSRGDVIGTRATLRNVFCKDNTGWHFPCSKTGREAKVVVGQLASGPFLLDDAAVKKRIQEQFKFAKGGEMEGWVLYTHIMTDYPDLEVIIIKGVADYADGEKDGRWQLTAAMAAANYTHFQLQRSTAFYDKVGDEQKKSRADPKLVWI